MPELKVQEGWNLQHLHINSIVFNVSFIADRNNHTVWKFVYLGLCNIILMFFKIQSLCHSLEDNQIIMAQEGVEAAETAMQLSSFSGWSFCEQHQWHLKEDPIHAVQCSTKLKILRGTQKMRKYIFVGSVCKSLRGTDKLELPQKKG